MNRFTAAVIAAIVATAASVLAVYGTDPDGLRATIHATARISCLCFILAYARIRTHDFLIALVASHALHYTAVLALGVTTSANEANINAVTATGGILIYALMVFAALRPVPWALHTLWFIFMVAFIGRDMSNPVYPVLLFLLFFVAPGVRGIRTPRPVER